MKRTIVLGLLLAALIGPDTTFAADARSAIEAVMKAYTAAAHANDARAVAAFYTADAILVGHGVPTKRGRAAIEAHATAAYKSAKVDYSITIDSIEAGEDVGSAFGTYGLTLNKQGQAAETLSGRFLFVLRRQSDGSWKVSRAISTDWPTEPK